MKQSEWDALVAQVGIYANNITYDDDISGDDSDIGTELHRKLLGGNQK